MRSITLLTCCLLAAGSTLAQNRAKNNPLINSGEVINEAVALHDKGEYKKAIELYRQIPENDTNYNLALYELALTCQADSQLALSRDYCHKALAHKPGARELDILLLIGTTYDDEKNFDKGLYYFDSVIRRFPNVYRGYHAKAVNYFLRQQYDTAAQYFQKAVLVNPFSVNSHFFLGNISFLRGEFSKAMMSWAMVLVIAPEGERRRSVISFMSSIANMEDGAAEIYAKRKPAPKDDNFSQTDDIIAAKIALDEKYKLRSGLKDNMVKQLQVLLEKLPSKPAGNGFWSQYYGPFYKSIFDRGLFEPFSYYIFSGVELDEIQNYLKKHKSETGEFFTLVKENLTKMGYAREKEWTRVNMSVPGYFFSGGQLESHGLLTGDLKKRVGEWIEYNGSGDVDSRVQYDQSGVKNGKFVSYYGDGKLYQQAQYKNDQLEGEAKMYYDNGNLHKQFILSGGKKNGLYHVYNRNGNPDYAETYADGKREGTVRSYFKSGALYYQGQYKNDEISGTFHEYYENGTLSYETNFLNGKRDGAYKSFFLDGKLHKQGTYKNGEMEGEWLTYYRNGKLYLKQNYKAGKLDGTNITYDTDGNEITIAQYDKGEKEGEVTHKNSKGQKWQVSTYSRGHLRKLTFYNAATGQVISNRTIEDKEKNFISLYDVLGGKVEDVVVDRDGVYNGKQTLYYSNGTVAAENEFKNGMKNGLSVKYHMNKNKKEECTYKDDKLEGYYQSWYDNGNIESEGWYAEDTKEGFWMSYNAAGKIVEKEYYLGGAQLGPQYYYTANGKHRKTVWYDYNIFEKEVFFDTTGKPTVTRITPNGNGEYIDMEPFGVVSRKATLKGGFFNGVHTEYYPDGKVSAVTYYKNGLLDTLYTSYFSNGKVSLVGSYVNNNKHGSWKHYHNVTGKLEKEEIFRFGEYEKVVYYYPDGKVETELLYSNGEKNGWTSKYSPGGELIYKILFQGGDAVSYTYEGKDGKLVPEIPLDRKEGHIHSFFSNGKVSADGYMINGVYHNKRTVYFPDGKVREEQTYVYGDNEGPYKEYYPDGKVLLEASYKDGFFVGPYKYYDESGKLRYEINYTNGYAHGPAKYYDASGKLLQTDNYYWGWLTSINK